MTLSKKAELTIVAREARKKVLEMIHRAGTSHIGPNFSCIEIFTILFEEIMDLKQDDFILSKGWAVATLYYFLVKKKILPKKALTTYCKPGSPYIGLAEPMKGIPFAGGSVGMGLSAGFGRALAKKLLNESGKVYVLESDGGMDVGLVWEAMLLCAHWKLDNLILIIDNNLFQAMGRKEDILSIKGIEGTFRSRNWEAITVNGHDFKALAEAIRKPQKKPRCIIANTLKGFGVKEFTGDNKWHYWKVDRPTYERSMKELCR